MLQCCRPENVPRLFDLIKVNDPSLRPAFYFAVRDTLVAKDLEQATRIAYGAVRYRVVTLNGQLIDTSGNEIRSFLFFLISISRVCLFTKCLKFRVRNWTYDVKNWVPGLLLGPATLFWKRKNSKEKRI